MESPISVAYTKIIEYALLYIQAAGKKSIKDEPDKSLIVSAKSQIDGCNWTFAVHGNSDKRNFKPEGCMDVFDLPGGQIAVWWNGWYAGILAVNGGVISSGDLANEDRLISDIEAEIEAFKLNPKIN